MLSKSTLKALFAKDMGLEMEQAKAKAEQAIGEHKGGAAAFSKAERILIDQSQLAKQEVIDGKADIDPEDPTTVAKFVVGHLMAATKKVHELAEGAAASALRAEGEAKAWGQAAKRHYDVAAREAVRAEATQEPPDASSGVGSAGGGPPPPRAVGTHPGPPMKAQRQAADEEPDKTPKKSTKKSAASKKSAPKRTRKKADAKDT